MIAEVEVGQGGAALLVSSGLLKEHKTRDRKAVGEACLAALEQWAVVRGLWGGEQAWRPTRDAERDPGPFPTNPNEVPKPT